MTASMLDQLRARSAARHEQERKSRSAVAQLERPAGETARQVAGETHRLWQDRLTRPAVHQAGAAWDPAVRELEAELRGEVVGSSARHAHRMAEIDRVKAELRELSLREQLEEQQRMLASAEMDKQQHVHDLISRDVACHNNEVKRAERNARLDAIRLRWDQNSAETRAESDARADRFCHELEANAESRHRAMHIRLVDADRQVMERAAVVEHSRFEAERIALREAGQVEMDRMALGQELAGHQNQVRLHADQLQQLEHSRVLELERERAERLKASLAQLEQERDQMAMAAAAEAQRSAAEAQRAADAEAGCQELAAQYERLLRERDGYKQSYGPSVEAPPMPPMEPRRMVPSPFPSPAASPFPSPPPSPRGFEAPREWAPLPPGVEREWRAQERAWMAAEYEVDPQLSLAQRIEDERFKFQAEMSQVRSTGYERRDQSGYLQAGGNYPPRPSGRLMDELAYNEAQFRGAYNQFL